MTEMWMIATFILLVGMFDDLRSRKVHNQLLLALFPIALLASVYFRGFDGTMLGVATLLGALVLTIPLFATGILGGGDVKLFAVFAMCLDTSNMFYTLVYSVVWGAVFGLTRATAQKQLFVLVRNTMKAARQQRLRPQEVHKFPYTFALVLGWFTQLTLLHAGGLI